MIKTNIFITELTTAEFVQQVAAENGVKLSIKQAHEAWAEHSNDYCASWLVMDSEVPKIEALQALTKYRERHSIT